MKARFFIIPIVLLTACQQIEQEDPNQKPDVPVQNTGDVRTLTILATKGDAETKALDLSTDANNKSVLTAYWKSEEKVQVYKGDTWLCQLDVTPGSGEKPTSATLSGDINVTGLNENDELTLLIPRTDWVYTGQNGTLTGTGSIEDTYDYAMATVTVNTITGTVVTIKEASAQFLNQQSVYRFTFTGISGMTIQEFTISSSHDALVQEMAWGGNSQKTGSITVTPSGDGPYFVALRNTLTEANNTTADEYTFLINGTVDSKPHTLLMATKPIPAGALDAPKFLSGTEVL